MLNRITDEETINDNIYKFIKYKEYKEKIENSIIFSRCGGKLLLKNGKYGKFYGCSKYPKCKYIKK